MALWQIGLTVLVGIWIVEAIFILGQIRRTGSIDGRGR